MNQPSVCVTLRGRTSEEMISDAPKAIKMGADLLEVRLDFLWTTEEKIRTTKISDEGEKEKVEVLVSKLDFEEIDFQKEIESAPVLGQGLVYATTESGWHLAQQGRINASDLRMAWEVMEYS